MSKNNIIEFEGREASTDSLNERLQAGAQKLIHQAVEAERYACLEQYTDRRAKDREELMAFYDFPAMHWQSIRGGTYTASIARPQGYLQISAVTPKSGPINGNGESFLAKSPRY